MIGHCSGYCVPASQLTKPQSKEVPPIESLRVAKDGLGVTNTSIRPLQSRIAVTDWCRAGSANATIPSMRKECRFCAHKFGISNALNLKIGAR